MGDLNSIQNAASSALAEHERAAHAGQRLGEAELPRFSSILIIGAVIYTYWLIAVSSDYYIMPSIDNTLPFRIGRPQLYFPSWMSLLAVPFIVLLLPRWLSIGVGVISALTLIDLRFWSEVSYFLVIPPAIVVLYAIGTFRDAAVRGMLKLRPDSLFVRGLKAIITVFIFLTVLELTQFDYIREPAYYHMIAASVLISAIADVGLRRVLRRFEP